jgi:hypothetical protein
MTLFVVELYMERLQKMHNALKNRRTRCKKPAKTQDLKRLKGGREVMLVVGHFRKKAWLFGLWFCSAEKVARRSPIDWLPELVANGFEAETNGSERDGI